MSEISSAIDNLVTRYQPDGQQPYGARLIVGVYDDPDDTGGATVRPRPGRMPIGDFQELSVPSDATGSSRGGDMQLITGLTDQSDSGSAGRGHAILTRGKPAVPKADPATSGSETGAGSSGGDTGLISGTIGLPGGSTESSNTAAASSLEASLGTPDPVSAFGSSFSTGSFHDMRLISEPVGVSGADPENVGASYGGPSQLHQLVAAMASFNPGGSSAIGAALAQNEVEVARTTLAAGLHF